MAQMAQPSRAMAQPPSAALSLGTPQAQPTQPAANTMPQVQSAVNSVPGVQQQQQAQLQQAMPGISNLNPQMIQQMLSTIMLQPQQQASIGSLMQPGSPQPLAAPGVSTPLATNAASGLVR